MPATRQAIVSQIHVEILCMGSIPTALVPSPDDTVISRTSQDSTIFLATYWGKGKDRMCEGLDVCLLEGRRTGLEVVVTQQASQ